ncbi:MAG: hypothetical protein WD844_10695 [Thermoleophilaceae bacterium]
MRGRPQLVVERPPADPAPEEVAPERVAGPLRSAGYSLPAAGEPLRVALVGQDTYFLACALEAPSRWAEPAFEEFRSGADPGRLLDRLRAADPHLVVVFRPELIPAGLFAQLGAVTIGWLTEPLPRAEDGSGAHPDQLRRLEYLGATDAGNFDRIVSFDPLMVTAAARHVPVWRSVPLPVADSIYVERIESDPECRPLFIGRSTPHREEMIERAKHVMELLHISHGTKAQELSDALRRTTISVNLHNEPYPSFENRVSLSLAAGRLLLSEPLSPTHGLEPGIDFIEVTNPWEVDQAIWAVKQYPEAYEPMRLRGRLKAELFRASRVYPRLVNAALHDLSVFGSQRSPGR